MFPFFPPLSSLEEFWLGYWTFIADPEIGHVVRVKNTIPETIIAITVIIRQMRVRSKAIIQFQKVPASKVKHSGAPVTNIPDGKVHGVNNGPSWGRQDPGGHHVTPMSFAIWDGLALSPAWMSNYIHYTVRDEIAYQFPNFNGSTDEV